MRFEAAAHDCVLVGRGALRNQMQSAPEVGIGPEEILPLEAGVREQPQLGEPLQNGIRETHPLACLLRFTVRRRRDPPPFSRALAGSRRRWSTG